MGSHLWLFIGVDESYVQEPVETSTWATTRLTITFDVGPQFPAIVRPESAPIRVPDASPELELEDSFPSFWSQFTEPEDSPNAWEC